MIVPDLNLLLYAYRQQDPNHDVARNWWQGLVDGTEEVGIPWAVATGFVRLITHPSSPTGPIPVPIAIEHVSQWFQCPHILPTNPREQHLNHLLRILEATGVGGNLVTDAHIAALALEYDAEVHSNDSDFGRFPGVRWHNPLQHPVA